MAHPGSNAAGSNAKPRPGGRAFAVLGWLALVVVLPAGLYVAHVLDSLREGEERNLRLLAKAASRVEKVLAVSRLNVEELCRGEKSPTEPELRRFADRQPYLVRAKTESQGAIGKPVYRVEKRPTLGRDPLLLDGGADCVFEVDFDATLRDLPLHREPRPFDQLLVVDSEAKVVFQRFEGLPGETAPGLRLATLEEPDKLTAGTFHAELELAGGSETHLLCQPMRLSLAPAGESPSPAEAEEGTSNERAELQSWALCGLVASSTQLQRALGVAPQLGLAIVIGLAYLVFAWPFIKLWLMDRHERFCLRDGYLLLVSTFACLSMTTVLLLDLDTYYRARGAVEDELEALAGEVESRLAESGRQLTTRLAAYDAAFDGSCREPDRDGRCALTGLNGQGPELAIAGAAAADGFTSVFWMDDAGRQLHKGSVYAQNTPFVDLDHRAYFRAIRAQVDRDNLAWSTDPPAFVRRRDKTAGAGEPAAGARVCSPFYLQPILSVTTGEREVAVSCPSRLVREDSEFVVIALTAEPEALLQPVVPPGFAFAVIDRGGEVLFHSDPVLALDENLFDEVGRRPRLRAAIDSGAKAHFASSYQTRPHLLYLRPLEATFPWYVVTFYDLELLRTVNLEALGATTRVALPYLLAISLPLLVIGVWRREAHWFWPDESRQGLYLVLVWVLVVVLLVQIFLVLHPVPGRGYWPSLLPPLVAAAVVASTLMVFGRSRERSRVTSRNHLYYGLSLLFWLVLAVLPSLGILQTAWQRQMDLLARYEAAGLERLLEERRARLDRRIHARGLEARRDGLLDGLEDVYTPVLRPDGGADPAARGEGRQLSIFRPVVAMEATCPPAGRPAEPPAKGPGSARLRWWSIDVAEILARTLPIYNRAARKLRYLGALDEESVAGRWEIGELEACLEPASRDLIATPMVIRVNRNRPPPMAGGWVLVAGAVLGTLLLIWWIRWVARNLFATRIKGQYPPFELGQFHRVKHCVVAHLADPRQHQVLADDGKLAHVDLSSRSDAAEEAIARLESERRRRPVVCGGFEIEIDDPAARLWKLAQLEHIVLRLKRTVILPTVWNPFEQLFALGRWNRQSPRGAAAGEEPGAPALKPATGPVPIHAEEAERWGCLLSHFELWPIKMTDCARIGGDRETVERRMERNEGFYWALWGACSDDERMALIQVTQERMLNPKQLVAVRGLLQRNLMIRRPDLRPFDPCFEAFIERIYEPRQVRLWERSFEGLGWRQLRWAFASVLTVLGLFLIAAQPELFDATVGFMSAASVALVPAILNLLSSLRRGGGLPATA